jgi:hypothetical protein
MALTSLPMPSYMPKETEFGYHWAGTRLGNTYTCNAQGFFASFGVSAMFFYTATLCIFYACSIAFTIERTEHFGNTWNPSFMVFPFWLVSCMLSPHSFLTCTIQESRRMHGVRHSHILMNVYIRTLNV